MPKKTKKDKCDDPIHVLTKSLNQTIEHVSKLNDSVNSMSKNMDILDRNMQHAIDKLEEMESIFTTIRKRMGLWNI